MKTWIERIEEANERGFFTDNDKELAGNWVTCACGEQDTILLYDSFGPKDDKLRMLGHDFDIHVSFDEIDEAEDTLALIQERAKELLHPIEEYADGRDFTPPYEP